MKLGSSDIDAMALGLDRSYSSYLGNDLVWAGFPNWEQNNVNGSIYLTALEFYTKNKSFDNNTVRWGNTGSGGYRWVGAVTLPSGKILAIPRDSTQILEIDPDAQTLTYYGSFPGTVKWSGGVLAPNGFIYCAPFSGGATPTNQVLKIDPIAKTASLIGSTYTGGGKWSDIILASNGKMYCTPFEATSVLVIDPQNDTTTTIGSIAASPISKYFGGTLAPNGNIYIAPRNPTGVLKINTSNDTISQFGSLGTGTGKWTGTILAPNGKLYGIPGNSTQVLEIDPTNDTTSLFGSISGTDKYYGGVLGPNGKIYCATQNAGRVLEIDPIARTASLVGNSYSGTFKNSSIGISLSGKILMFGGLDTAVTQLGVSQPNLLNTNFVLSRHNKKS